MSIQHHIDPATVMRYASGNVDEAFSIIIACHLAMCPICRAKVYGAEEIGGELLASLDQAELPKNAFDVVMQCIDAEDQKASENHIAHDEQATENSDVPKPLQRFVGNSLDNISWRTLAPGLRRHSIDLGTDSKSSLYLLQIGAGMKVPEHGHGGTEMTLVLSGAFRDSMGLFKRGDIEDLDENIEHQPHVEPGAPCICLVATEAPTRFKGFFSRLLQPLFGI